MDTIIDCSTTRFGGTQVWQLPDKKRTACITTHGDTIGDMHFAAASKLLVTCGANGGASVWAMPDGAPVSSLASPSAGPRTHACMHVRTGTRMYA